MRDDIVALEGTRFVDQVFQGHQRKQLQLQITSQPPILNISVDGLCRSLQVVDATRCFVHLDHEFEPVTQLAGVCPHTGSAWEVIVNCGATPPTFALSDGGTPRIGEAIELIIDHEQQRRMLSVIERHLQNVDIALTIMSNI